MAAVNQLAPDVGIHAACDALGVVRSSFYRQQHPAPVAEPRPAPPRALSAAERETVLAHLHEERFQDRSPAAVQATLLDEGIYRCSTRTMYRILAEHGETGERRDQRIHPVYRKPELLATAPNELWSWDITKLLGPAKWTYFYLYVILDVFSRYVVGWMIAPRESAELARKLIEETCIKQQIQAGQLTIHADRGSSMTSKPVAFLLADLGVTKTHSRPHVSDDNPYSESQFRTMKYRPDFPDRFGSPLRIAAHTRRSSLPGTTKTTGIPALGSSARPWSITAKPTTSFRNGRPSSTLLTWRTPNDSSARHQNHSQFQRRSGSTNQTRQRINVTKLLIEVSQTH